MNIQTKKFKPWRPWYHKIPFVARMHLWLINRRIKEIRIVHHITISPEVFNIGVVKLNPKVEAAVKRIIDLITLEADLLSHPEYVEFLEELDSEIESRYTAAKEEQEDEGDESSGDEG